MGYEAIAVTSQGFDLIDSYASKDDAVADVLDVWLEEDDDVFIVDDETRQTVAYMARGTRLNTCTLIEDGRVTGIYYVTDVPETARVRAIVGRVP